ncbi:MAG: 16S rRNA (uracil(1498)-N(3))-methyltransferase [Phycisphaerales bacterium]|nr:16S rRNA (uracil(1498)-N(3))-methyltransferase [Phycisphaerales bacterium]
MSLHRIYLPQPDELSLETGSVLEIAGPEAHHALAVKRIAAGDRVEVFDGRGLIVAGAVVAAGKRRLSLRVESAERSPRPEPEVIIAAPPPKGPRAEMMIEQLSQAGASRWAPLLTERSIVEPRDKRVARWRESTAVESAKQCGRAWLMDIDEPMPLERCLARAGGLLVLVADAAGKPCVEAIDRARSRAAILLLVGPEGGFSSAEREIIARAGAIAVSLGPHILRIETAAVIGAAAVVQCLALSPAPRGPSASVDRSG